MSDVSRRAFLGAAAGSLCVLRAPGVALAADCASALAPVAPGILNCAAAQNFRLLQAYPDDLGLIGLVAIAPAKAQSANLRAGTFMLFPYLRGNAATNPRRALQAYLPTGGKRLVFDPGGLPPDEFFVRSVLVAPWTSFIGFTVQSPYDTAAWLNGDDQTPVQPARFDSDQSLRPWRTNLARLGPGKNGSVGVEWTSQSLNDRWFAGSRWIPADDTCSGTGWRKLIVDGIRQAALATGC
jgi:hypothetical protein